MGITVKFSNYRHPWDDILSLPKQCVYPQGHLLDIDKLNNIVGEFNGMVC